MERPTVRVWGDEALVCSIPPGFALRNVQGHGLSAQDMYLACQQRAYSAQALADHDVEWVPFRPPVTSIDEAWRRADCGFGSTRQHPPGSSDTFVPFFECVERPGMFYPLDTHCILEFHDGVPCQTLMERALEGESIQQLERAFGVPLLEGIWTLLHEPINAAALTALAAPRSRTLALMFATSATQCMREFYATYVRWSRAQAGCPTFLPYLVDGESGRCMLIREEVRRYRIKAHVAPFVGRALRRVAIAAHATMVENYEVCKREHGAGFCAVSFANAAGEVFPVRLVYVHEGALRLYERRFPDWRAEDVPLKMWRHLYKRSADRHTPREPYEFIPPLTLAAACASPYLLPEAARPPSVDVCVHCGQRARRRCGGCSLVRVCGEGPCAQEYWAAHKGMCRALQLRAVPADLMRSFFPDAWDGYEVEEGDIAVVGDGSRGVHRPLAARVVGPLQAALAVAAESGRRLCPLEDIVGNIYGTHVADYLSLPAAELAERLFFTPQPAPPEGAEA